MYSGDVSRHVAARWNSLPDIFERWAVSNAVFALAGAAVCLGLRDLRPALFVGLSSLTWFWLRAAPSGVGIASAITATRTGILVAALGLVPDRGTWIAVAALANFALDGIDGWVARKLGQTSAFGARFDMESDSHTVLWLDLQLVIHSGYPVWVLWAGVLRYAFVLSRFVVDPCEFRERRSNYTRWVFSLVFVSRTFACLPDMREFALPLLAVATLAVSASFAPDFWALRSARRAAP
jgi:phosphatidylglycerophosphate synthase